jgi:hypothetical protein
MTSLIKTILITGALSFLVVTNEEKAATLSDKSKIVYHVTDDQKMDGAYTITDTENKLLLRGVYKDNQRSGNWFCFNPDGTVFMRYNYDLKKVVALDSKAISRAKIDIDSKDKTIQTDASVPVPVCSVQQYISLVGVEFERQIMQENKSAEGLLEADLIASIDKDGKATYSANYDANGITMKKKIRLNDKLFNIEWIPASYKGEKLASTFAVKIAAQLGSDPRKRQRFTWAY